MAIWLSAVSTVIQLRQQVHKRIRQWFIDYRIVKLAQAISPAGLVLSVTRFRFILRSVFRGRSNYHNLSSCLSIQRGHRAHAVCVMLINT